MAAGLGLAVGSCARVFALIANNTAIIRRTFTAEDAEIGAEIAEKSVLGVLLRGPLRSLWFITCAFAMHAKSLVPFFIVLSMTLVPNPRSALLSWVLKNEGFV